MILISVFFTVMEWPLMHCLDYIHQSGMLAVFKKWWLMLTSLPGIQSLGFLLLENNHSVSMKL